MENEKNVYRVVVVLMNSYVGSGYNLL
jgi:hypothetical protein